MPRVLIVAGDAVEAHEVFYPYWRLREQGIEVHVAAPSRRPIRTVIHDREEGWDTYTERPGYVFRWVDMEFAEVRPEEFDGLIIPGGRAPEHIRLSPDLERIVRHFFEAGKPVGAICHGPLVLTAYGLVRGRRLTCTSLAAPDVRAAGGEYVNREVVVDGNLVTSRAWPDLPAFMREFLRLLGAGGP